MQEGAQGPGPRIQSFHTYCSWS